EERTFPGRVDDALAERLKGTPPVEVGNTGVAGTGVDFATGMLIHRVLPLDPDLCVFLVAHNVFFDSLRTDWHPRAVPQPEPPPTVKDWLSGARRPVALLDARKRAKNNLVDNKRSFYEAHRQDRHKFAFTPPPVDVLRGIPHFKTCLKRIAALCRDAKTSC